MHGSLNNAESNSFPIRSEEQNVSTSFLAGYSSIVGHFIVGVKRRGEKKEKNKDKEIIKNKKKWKKEGAASTVGRWRFLEEQILLRGHSSSDQSNHSRGRLTATPCIQ